MYSARFADLKLKKSQLDQLQNSNLDSSYYSNKSKKSVKEHLAEFRNQSPGSTSRPISANSGQNSKVKLMLNQLVSGDLARHKEEKLNTQLFTQNLLKPKLEKTTSAKNLTKQPKPKFQATKTKPTEILTNREKAIERSNVYFMFNNKQSEPQIKPISNTNKSNNLMTLSQLAQQCKQKTSKNTTPQRKPDQVSNYLEQIQQLKQQFENSSQKKVIDTNQEKQGIKSHKAKSQNNSQEKENNIVKLYLQKEFFWHSLLRDIEHPKEVSKVTQQLQIVIRDISEKQNSEYLFRINPHLVDTILLESYTLLIIAVEYLKLKQQSDLNQKNLVQYITQSNLFSLQLLNIQFNNEQIQQRVEQRQTANRKVQNGRQSLQKNNYIVRSILELIIDDTSRPDIYTQLGFNMNSLDLFLVQQKKILSQIAMEINSDISTETNDTTNLLPQKPAKQYTLVLDLDETLVHYQEFPNGGGQFLVRPYAEEFLKAISKYYEIVIFTAAMPDYANFIIDIIDKGSVISARLFREHTLYKDNVYIKDLSIIGRSLAKTIIVDNMPENFQLQPENGIFIQGWYGEQKDRALKDLQPLLEEIAIKKCKDVRLALNCFREQMIERVQLGIKNPYTNLQLN